MCRWQIWLRYDRVRRSNLFIVVLRICENLPFVCYMGVFIHDGSKKNWAKHFILGSRLSLRYVRCWCNIVDGGRYVEVGPLMGGDALSVRFDRSCTKANYFGNSRYLAFPRAISRYLVHTYFTSTYLSLCLRMSSTYLAANWITVIS